MAVYQIEELLEANNGNVEATVESCFEWLGRRKDHPINLSDDDDQDTDIVETNTPRTRRKDETIVIDVDENRPRSKSKVALADNLTDNVNLSDSVMESWTNDAMVM